MTVLIGHGYVGNAIARELERQGIRFLHQHHDNWRAGKGEFIINAAGYLGSPNVDACEIHRRETIEGNIAWPLKLARHPVLHIGTGCIYQGDNGGKGWAETDKPNFEASFYSLTKVLAEEVLASTLENSYILRIRQPFGAEAHPRNLLTKLRAYKKLNDVTNSISCIDDVARVVAWFVRYRPPGGIYNCTNPGSANVGNIAYRMGLNKEWFTPEEFAEACPAPRSNCTLYVAKLSALFPLPSVWEALESAIRQYR